MIDFTNFHDTTRAEFAPSAPPDREPDFVSPSGSVYWDMAVGVFRASDHWAGMNGCTGQASCVWSLLDAIRPGVWTTGYCDYQAFAKRRMIPRLLPVSDVDRRVAARLAEAGGAYVEDAFIAPPVPIWAKINLRGSMFSDARAEILFAQNAKARRVITGDVTALNQIIGGEDHFAFGKILY